MNLSTTYLGLKLSSPLMPGASPLVDNLDRVRAMQDAGASAIVMHSLFEEQIVRERFGREHLLGRVAVVGDTRRHRLFGPPVVAALKGRSWVRWKVELP